MSRRSRLGSLAALRPLGAIAPRLGKLEPPGVTPRIRGRLGVQLRRDYLARHPLCVHCERAGRVTAARIVDHIRPLGMLGTYDEGNLQALCRACHEAKTREDVAAIAKARGL